MKNSVGIEDMAVFIPKKRFDLSDLIALRTDELDAAARKLSRAIKLTGQKSIRYPDSSEDSATIAAEAAYRLFCQNAQILPESIRYITVGTETSLDHSKPISAYLLGMLRQANIKLRSSLSSFQVQHACAGGALSLIAVAAMLASSGRPEEVGLVVCSDIARYPTSTSAEITHGAGGTAVAVKSDPSLIALDLGSIGYASNDVDDFFRPLGSDTARVKGQYSMQCYIEALNSALTDCAARRGISVADLLNGTDLIALHTPFTTMPEYAMIHALKTHCGYSEAESREFLGKRHFFDGVSVVADIGNIYNGSLFLTLASLLQSAHRSGNIAGKNVLLGAYGSGNIMAVIPGMIAPRATTVIDRWNLDHSLNHSVKTDSQSYIEWISSSLHSITSIKKSSLSHSDSDKHFSLSRIREDGYREYEFA